MQIISRGKEKTEFGKFWKSQKYNALDLQLNQTVFSFWVAVTSSVCLI